MFYFLMLQNNHYIFKHTIVQKHRSNFVWFALAFFFFSYYQLTHLSRLAKGNSSQEGTSVSATGFDEEQIAGVVTGPSKTELVGGNGEAMHICCLGYVTIFISISNLVLL